MHPTCRRNGHFAEEVREETAKTSISTRNIAYNYSLAVNCNIRYPRAMTTPQSTRTVEQFMDDPIAFFGESLTQMHGIPRDELEELQRQAMAIRFQQHRHSIEIVRKLADRLGVTEVNDFNDRCPAALLAHRFQVVSRSADRQQALRPDDQVAGQTHQPRPVRGEHRRLRQHRRVDRPARRADTAGSDHLQRDDGNVVDHPEGQARRARRHGAVEDLPVSDVRHRTHRSGTRSRGRRHLAQLRQGQARATCASPT